MKAWFGKGLAAGPWPMFLWVKTLGLSTVHSKQWFWRELRPHHQLNGLTLGNVSGSHSVSWRSEKNKKTNLPEQVGVLQQTALGREPHQFQWEPDQVCWVSSLPPTLQAVDFPASPPNHLNQFLLIQYVIYYEELVHISYICMYKLNYILLVRSREP